LKSCSAKTSLQIDQDLHLEPRTFAPVVMPALLSTYRSAQRYTITALQLAAFVPDRFFALPLTRNRAMARVFWNVLILHGSIACRFRNTITMTTHMHTQDAIRTLTTAFAPMNCLIMAARKGCFSFTIVNEHGIARHSERLYPDQYSSAEPLQAVIDRTRQALTA